MYRTKPDETVIRLMNTLHQTGIWRSEKETFLCGIVRKYFFLFYSIAFQAFNGASAYFSQDMTETVFLTEIGMYYTVVTFKQVSLLWKKNEITSFLNDPITAHSTDSRAASQQANSKLANFMRFVEVYLAMLGVTSTFIGLSCIPPFTTGKKLPFFISYSFDWKSEIVYWVMYGFVSLAILYGYLFNLITVFVWYLMFNYFVAYEVLGDRLARLGHVDQSSKERGGQGRHHATKESTRLYQSQLIDLIRTHRSIFQTIERFKSCFSGLFLSQMTTSAISICISTYNMAYSSHENIIQSIIFAVVFLYGVFDIFLIMYLANEITWASNRLTYCLFESNWLDQSGPCKRCVIILGEMVQRPQHLVILNFPMNLTTFTSIINGAYRMFNILQRFRK